MNTVTMTGTNPGCDIECDRPAAYDAPTVYGGSWAYLCETHYNSHGAVNKSIGSNVIWVDETVTIAGPGTVESTHTAIPVVDVTPPDGFTDTEWE